MARLFDALSGLDAEDQRRLDTLMIELDGTANKSRLPKPTPSSASPWRAPRRRGDVGRACRSTRKYVGGVSARRLPLPMMNIINGGDKHADNPIDIQEFMILPTGAPTFAEALRMGAEIFHALKAALKAAGHNTNVGDEGGFAPNLARAEDALAFIVSAGDAAGYKAGRDFHLGLDAASSEFFRDGRYQMDGEGKSLDPAGMVDYLAALVDAFPIVSIEDGCAEDDFAGWKLMTDRLGGKIQLVGDDVFVTNPARLAQGIEQGLANSILVKVNQIGTLSETLDAVDMAHRNAYTAGDVAHRSGEDSRQAIDHRRPGGGDQLRTDQDGLAVPIRPHGQVQPAAADRGTVG